MRAVRRVRVDAVRLSENASRLAELVGDFYCVVKCDAYGHGLEDAVRAFYEADRRSFAVCSAEEAVRVKNTVKDAEVLILGRTEPEYLPELAERGIKQTVFSLEYAEAVKTTLAPLKVHIKLDTGMNRSGFTEDAQVIKKAFSGFRGAIEGVYTHFSSADHASLSNTEKQLSDFVLRSNGLSLSLGHGLKRHAAASAAALRMKTARLDGCRIGLALYGIAPDNCNGLCRLLPAMSFTAPIDTGHIKQVNSYFGRNPLLCECNSGAVFNLCFFSACKSVYK